MTPLPHHCRSFLSPSFSLRRSAASRFLGCLFLAGLVLSGCKKSEKKQEPVSAPSASVEAKKPVPPPFVPPQPKGAVQPVGPSKVIVPGKGVNAVRFGTNLENLERHMEAPCDIKSGDVETKLRCVYVDQAAEFELEQGLVSKMKFHRRGRKVQQEGSGEQKYFGSFRGGMRPKIMFGLHRHIVVEEFGEPLKKEELKGPDGQVERHFHKGVIFEFDQIENKNIVLSGIEVIREDASEATSKSAPKASK